MRRMFMYFCIESSIGTRVKFADCNSALNPPGSLYYWPFYGHGPVVALPLCSLVVYSTRRFILGFAFNTKTCLYNFDPLIPHFHTVKLGFTGVYNIFLISAQKQRLWVLVRTASTRRL